MYSIKIIVVPKFNYISMRLPICIPSYILSSMTALLKALYGREKTTLQYAEKAVCRKGMPQKREEV